MAENPKLDLDSATLTSCEMETQKISVISDYKREKSDSFVVDIENFSHVTDKDTKANSRITRSLSRKGSQRGGGGGEKKTNASITASERDTVVATSSPRATLVGASTPEMPMVVATGTTDHHPTNPQAHHQITINTGNISTTAESRYGNRRYSFRRSPPSWAIDPRKILLFFATLSSMGSILLIYFTLSITKLNADDNALD